MIYYDGGMTGLRLGMDDIVALGTVYERRQRHISVTVRNQQHYTTDSETCTGLESRKTTPHPTSVRQIYCVLHNRFEKQQ